MRVMVMVKATAHSESGAMPSTELLTSMGRYNDDLAEADVMRAAEGLHPSSKGKRVAFDGQARAVSDGPFRNPNELVAGFWVWEVKDMDEAIEWAKRCPNPMPGPSELELRPIFEMEEFGDELTPALAEQEKRQRARIEKR